MHNLRYSQSDILRDALSELDNASEKITFTFSAHSPHFRISTVGMAGSTEVNFSKDTDIIESFYSAEPAQHAYRYNQVQHALNALVYSSKTSVRINQYGFLSMQFMIQADRGDACFVELLCAPMQSFEQLI
ncbi:checkpoint clamp complex protein Rad1 [Dimargaris cristalligena]|nr:checkpoint clamp complex protein Rad1 [Dimargaris cristalligena]